MNTSSNLLLLTRAKVTDTAVRANPRLWPLASSVAVNPFLGQATETLARGWRAAGARRWRARNTAAQLVQNPHREWRDPFRWVAGRRSRVIICDGRNRRAAAITDIMNTRILWEEALFGRYNEKIANQWDKVQAAHADQTARFIARANRVWGRYKLAAVSSLAFVESTGPIHPGQRVCDALNFAPINAPAVPVPRLDPALNFDAQTHAADTILRAMSLANNFARLVVLPAHGATIINTPISNGRACKGYRGEVIARLLNSADARNGPDERDITVPNDPLFIAALHDTTKDAIK